MQSSGSKRRGTAPKCPKCAQFYKGEIRQHICAKSGAKHGHVKTPETCAKLSAALKGRKPTEEARRNMRAGAARRSLRGPREFSLPAAREKAAAARRGKPTGWFQTPEARNKRAIATADAERRKESSSIELIVRTVLAAMGIDFVRSQPCGSYIIDILVSSVSLAIECDGSYWHSGKTAAEHDAKKDACLIAHGLKVLRLPEQEIRSGEFYVRLCAALGMTANSLDGRAPLRVTKKVYAVVR